jgi:hypothetical protein
LEDQITIVKETTSHENNRRDGRALRVDSHESGELGSRPLAQARLLLAMETQDESRALRNLDR